jgi:ribosomal-protein-alanine N-acetyltransferase
MTMKKNTIDLLIDTTRDKLVLIILYGAKYDLFISKSRRHRHASMVLTEIDALLQKNGLNKDMIETIGVVVGPGSFTGIRIGVSTANALSYALGAKVIEINSLEVIIKLRDKGVAIIDCGNENYYILERDGADNNCYYIASKEDISKYNLKGIDVYGEEMWSEEGLIDVFLEKKKNGYCVLKAIPFYIRETSADRGTENKYSVRKAESDDLQQIIDIELESFNNPWFKESISKYIIQSGCLVLVHKEVQETIVGYLMYQTISEDEIEILKVALKSEFRGAGLGRFLLDALNEEARERRLTNIILEVAANNIPAIRLYEKNNFKKEGLRKKYYNNNIDAILYRRVV